MGFFKEIYCADCGKKTNLLLRTKLGDQNYICSDCTSRIPQYFLDCFLKYTLEDYFSLKEYIEYSDKVLRPVFDETDKYYEIHVDIISQLFHIGNLSPNTVFFHFSNVENFDLKFLVEELKEGVIGEKVVGKVLFRLKLKSPYCYYEKILDNHAKAKAKKTFFGSEIRYENPKGMNEFLALCEMALETCAAQEDDLNGIYTETSQTDLELQQALALFMLDDLNGVELSELKSQRNRLIKTFHPDKSSDDNTNLLNKVNRFCEKKFNKKSALLV